MNSRGNAGKKSGMKSRILCGGLAIMLAVTMLPAQELMAAQQEKNTEPVEASAVEEPVIEEIAIRDVDEFLAFAASCDIDSWSANKYVTLEKDIDLTGTDFEMIPVFAGIFDGLGHTISGFENGGSG